MSEAPFLTRVVLRNYKSFATCDVALGKVDPENRTVV